MKFSTILKFLLAIIALSFSGTRLSSADEGGAFSVATLTFDTITKVEQWHNPGLGPNQIGLTIEGKSGMKAVSARISGNFPGTGTQNIFESCQKDAMLAFHYPDRYRLEIASPGSLPSDPLNIYFENSGGDNVICTLKSRVSLQNPVLNQPIKAIPLTN